MATIMRAPAVFLSILFVALLATSWASALTVTADYFNIERLRTAQLTLSGITVSGTNTLDIHRSVGVWGNSSTGVDSGEAVSFDFVNNDATSVSYRVLFGVSVGTPAPAGRILEAFALDGRSLGSIYQKGIGVFDVSRLFGDTALSAFTLRSLNDATGVTGFTVKSVTYTTALPLGPDIRPTPMPVPLPSAFLPFLASILLLAVSAGSLPGRITQRQLASGNGSAES